MGEIAEQAGFAIEEAVALMYAEGVLPVGGTLELALEEQQETVYIPLESSKTRHSPSIFQSIHWNTIPISVLTLFKHHLQQQSTLTWIYTNSSRLSVKHTHFVLMTLHRCLQRLLTPILKYIQYTDRTTTVETCSSAKSTPSHQADIG